MALVSSDRIADLKERVKAECARRAFSGSVVSYAGTEYDYTVTPASGVIIKQEHRDKIATPLNAINSDIIAKASGQITISDGDITNMEAFVTVLESREPTDNQGTDCKGGCTGMCYGCQGTCYNGCTTSCSGSCTGCSGTCTATCADSCSSGCRGGCWNACTGCTGCSGSCKGSCTGCGGSCTGGSGQVIS